MNAPLTVVAVVTMNNGEALVLNRPLAIKYEQHGKDFIGSDGPFKDVLYYERGAGRFVAFAGRELTLNMADGTTQKVKNHWWNGSMKGLTSAVVSDVESLRICYVFRGGLCADPDELAALRATYTGCVYPYWDYEKVINFDAMRRDLYNRLSHEERRRLALIQAVKRKHGELIAARSTPLARAPEGFDVLPPAALATARAFGAGLDAASLEHPSEVV